MSCEVLARNEGWILPHRLGGGVTTTLRSGHYQCTHNNRNDFPGVIKGTPIIAMAEKWKPEDRAHQELQESKPFFLRKLVYQTMKYSKSYPILQRIYFKIRGFHIAHITVIH